MILCYIISGPEVRQHIMAGMSGRANILTSWLGNEREEEKETSVSQSS
jgi:hypothetical protein